MAAPVLVRNVEHIDDGVLDPKIDAVLEAPAHRGPQFRRRHFRGLDQCELIVLGAEHGADRYAGDPGGPQGFQRAAGAGVQGKNVATLEDRLRPVAAHDGQCQVVGAKGDSHAALAGQGLSK